MKALRDNYRLIRSHVDKTDKNAEIICVVKADGYGHGAGRCSSVFKREGARNFAVSNLDEAIEVRRAVGDGAMILILGYTDPAYADDLVKYGITQTVFSEKYARALSKNLKGMLNVHIKIDTGMNRLGFSSDEDGIDAAARCARLPGLHADGIFTHFADADEADEEPTRRQFERFMHAIKTLEGSGISFRMRHCCNSAATVRFPDMYLNAVRCGIILYGLNPSDCSSLSGLTPVMSLHSRIVHIHEVHPGERISYGGTFSPCKPVKVATVPIGYDDGLLRSYASEGFYINGKYAKILGRICMDQCMVDITDIDCREGDNVEIFGSHQSVDTFARAASTINYEVTCMVGKRVPRDEV